MKHYEDAEQAAVFEWAGYYKELRWMHAIANGGKRNIREAARLKKQGVKPGVYDIFLPMPMDHYHGLYIEMKRRKKEGPSRPTLDQLEFGLDMLEEGYKVVVCYGANEAIEVITRYADL